MKISICIPSRAPVLGLWATICAAANDLGNIEHEFIVVINGRSAEDEELFILHQWPDSHVRIIHHAEVLSPTDARNLAASHATGEFLVFLDDHCIVAPGWFQRVLFNDKDILHSALSGAPGRSKVYHFIRNDDQLITGRYAQAPKYSKTYRVLSAQAAGFAVRRSTWEHIGGYGNHFDGYGGEEAFLNIKAQMLGHEVWLDPEMLFYHYFARSGIRGYERIENKENWWASAFVLGNQYWADKEKQGIYNASDRAIAARAEFAPRIIWQVEEVLGRLPGYHD